MKGAPMMFREHEKFWAFLTLIIAIVALSALASQVEAKEAGLRILDAAVVGLIGIAGMAGQSLFRSSKTDENLAEAARLTAEKVPPLTGEAREEQAEQEAEGLPPMARS